MVRKMVDLMRFFGWLIGILALCSNGVADDSVSVLDPNTVTVSTFRSHNNRHVIVGDQLFVSYLRNLSADERTQSWRVVRQDLSSKHTITAIERVNATRPPCIDRDRDGNVFVVFSDWALNRIVFYRIDKSTGQVGAVVHYEGPIGPASYKFTCAFDVARNRFVYFGNAGRLIAFNASGDMIFDQHIFQFSDDHWVQYPHIFIEPSGRIHLAWTNSHRAHPWFYTSTHYLYSDDATTWRRAPSETVTLPVICSDSAGGVQIAGQTDTGVHRLLTSFIPHNGLVHFAYAENPYIDDPAAFFKSPTGNVTHYTSYNPATGKLSATVLLEKGGTAANSIDGEFVRDDNALYYVASSAGKEIAVFITNNNGVDWRLFKTLPLSGDFCPYALGAHRTPHRNHIFGTLTAAKLGACAVLTEPAETLQFVIRIQLCVVRECSAGGIGPRVRVSRLVTVQTGSDLGEDDIERFDDDYHRT